MHELYVCILTTWVFIFMVLLLHLILHPAQPAAVTTVTMERLSTGERKRWREEMRDRLRGEREEREIEKIAARAGEWSSEGRGARGE